MSGGRRLGFALAGLGKLSANQIAPAFERTQRCRLAGIVTGSPDEAARWQERYGIPARSVYDYGSIDRMAENPDIDVVYVVTPNALRAPIAIAAARAGKHVFCEKPLEISVARCREMIEGCRAAGTRLGVAYRCRFDPHHLECVRLAREEVFGRVRMIQGAFGFAVGEPPLWRLDRSLSGGGPLIDVGIYCLQTARMITGREPLAVSATEVRNEGGRFGDVEQALTFQLEFPDGVLAHFGCSYEQAMNEFTVFAEHGSFGMKPAYAYQHNRAWRSDGAPFAFPEIDQFAAEMDDFALRIETGEPSPVDGEEGVRDVRILLAAYESARTGRRVELVGRARAGGQGGRG